MTIETIKKRNEIIKTVKKFFAEKDYLEVETPLLSPSLIPESTIEIFETDNVHPFKDTQKSYLTPSPEVWLKKFISKNRINIFEVSKCFRNSEQSGKEHNPEFTMIEYYTMGYNYKDTLKLTKELIDYINSVLPYSKLPKTFRTITMEEAFIKYAGFSLQENYTTEKLHKQATRLGIAWDSSDNWESAFNRIFIDMVEPGLPKNVNLFLTDFPANIKTLAKNVPDSPWSQRWELYINGIECGNCYSEETAPEAVKTYFENETVEKNKTGIITHKIDMDYYNIFKNFPTCSGGAIGIDRLIMGILGIEDIRGVILFPCHDNIY